MLPTIQVPTLVLQRADAVLVPADVGRYVARTIEGSRYVEVAGTAGIIEREGDRWRTLLPPPQSIRRALRETSEA